MIGKKSDKKGKLDGKKFNPVDVSIRFASVRSFFYCAFSANSTFIFRNRLKGLSKEMLILKYWLGEIPICIAY